MGLATVVAHHATFQVGLLQECHIHKCHASEIEAEQEQVSCLVKGGTCWQVQFLYFTNILYCYGTLCSSHVSCLHVNKDVVGWSLPCFHSLVVDGAESSQIERHGVLSDTSVPKPCLIHFHHLAGHLREGQVFLVAKFHESVSCIGIVVLGANALHLLLLGYLLAEESKNALARWQLLYLLGYVVNGIRDALCILITDDTLHLLHLPICL